MLVLAVDTSTKAGSVAVLRDGRLLGVRTSNSTQPHASGLFVDLQALLDELRISLETFDLFAVASGPGSFTGLRIGLTAAKAWAEAFNHPLVAVSSLEAIAFQALKVPDLPVRTVVAAVQDARRGQVFGRAYDYLGGPLDPFAPLGEEVLVSAPEFVHLVADQVGARRTVFVSPAAEPIGSAFAGTQFEQERLITVSAVLAPFIGEIGYARALRGETVDALQLDANYVRRTDAEVKWVDAKWKDGNRDNANRSDRKSDAAERKDPSLT
jgi:tRNA threonylcarbamoyladenosine biosynthesis protein TsaB